MTNNASAPNSTAQPTQPKTAMGITSLVLGIIALLTSFIPIVNNGSAVLGVLGVIFGVVGLISCARGKRTGKGIAIAALVVNIVAFAIVLGTQSMFVAAFDEATSGPAATSVSTSN